MQGTVLTWTRVERPPAGVEAGRVVVLVEAGTERFYARWDGPGEPAVGAAVRLEEAQGSRVARA